MIRTDNCETYGFFDMFFYFVWKFNVSNLAQTNYLNHLVFQSQIQCNQIYQIGVKSVTDFVKVLRLLQTGLEQKTKLTKVLEMIENFITFVDSLA